MAEETKTTGRPLQKQTWTEKNANKQEWFRRNIEYHIGTSAFNSATTNSASAGKQDLAQLYNIYNNKFPLSFFDHITNPLNAAVPAHKKYPAKIRPTGMLRTNIDLLLGEYPTRPFAYQVANLGEDAYNSFLENLNGAIAANLEEHFIAETQAQLAARGIPVEEMPQEDKIELPDSVKQRFTASYKDKLAIRGQKWLKRTEREYRVKQKMLKMFKDWLIVGRSVSYKNIENDTLVYDHVSPLEIDCGGSNSDFMEDSEWIVRRRFMNVSEVVDSFYDEIKEAQLDELESRNWWSSPTTMYTHLTAISQNDASSQGKVPVYHVQWKGRVAVKIVQYTDPLTGEMEVMRLDEDTPIDDDMVLLKTEWVNEGYEGWRVSDNMYFRMRPIPVQRNAMNNFSYCKLSYNGRFFSNTHSENTSVMQMGLPYAIMYMITNYTLEKTIAKNKGKIALIDQNAIPKQDGWSEEKFFYYADALGYMLINRNQIGVDKSFNQYTTMDLSLFDQIEKLIMLRDSFLNDWDKMLGINPQRKAQINPGDGLGTTRTALAASSVITAMIFTLFEEFVETELQGLLDYSRFTNVNGIRGIYNLDDLDRELLTIDPHSYCSAELGVFVRFSAEELQVLEGYKAQVQAMIQNGVRQSTILEIQQANNLAELMSKLKQIEEIEMEQAQAAEISEQEREKEILEIQERMEMLKSTLKIQEIDAEWDRKDGNEMIKGAYSSIPAGGDGDVNDNGIPDASEITKRIIAAQQMASAERQKARELQLKETALLLEQRNAEEARKLEREKLESKERIEKAKNKVALRNKVSGE